MSTILGRWACLTAATSVSEVTFDGHWRKSYTSSVIMSASYSLATCSSSSRRLKLIVFDDGLENVGTA